MLREIAEYPNSFGAVAAGGERIETDRFTLCMGAGSTWNTVQRHRFGADQVDEVRSEVHALLAARGRGSTQWEIGSGAEPANLVELLLERGVVPDRDPYAVALVLRTEPPPGPAGAVARRVETFDEYAAANEVQFEAFGETGPALAESRAMLPATWADRTTFMHAARPWRLPRPRPRTLGGGGRARHADPDHSGRVDVAPDTRTGRVRAHRVRPHPARRVRREPVSRR
jgi:hypothetical protein